MTVRKLKRMLRKTPVSGKIMVVGYAAVLALIIYAELSMMKSDTPQVEICLVSVAFALLSYLAFFNICKIIAGARRVKKYGKKTIEYLESNGLMEAAVEEYNHPNKVFFRAANRDLSMDKFSQRDNTLTENFVFALSSNQIIRYQDVAETYLVHYFFVHAGTYTNAVFTLRTNDGDEVDLLSYQLRMFVTPPQKTIDWICSVIKYKNPQCKVSSEHHFTRGRKR